MRLPRLPPSTGGALGRIRVHISKQTTSTTRGWGVGRGPEAPGLPAGPPQNLLLLITSEGVWEWRWMAQSEAVPALHSRRPLVNTAVGPPSHLAQAFIRSDLKSSADVSLMSRWRLLVQDSPTWTSSVHNSGVSVSVGLNTGSLFVSLCPQTFWV